MTRLIGLNRPEGVEREENDFYATHPHALPPLLNLLGFNDGKRRVIRENSCGEGHLGIPLELSGHTVIATDLIDRGYGVSGIDFLKPHPVFDTMRYDAVIMNPPYKLGREFVEKSLTLAPVVASFFRINFLESEEREELFKNFPPRYAAVFSRRAKSAKYAAFTETGSSPVFYAWFIWYLGYQGDPSIKWIRPEETPYVRQTLEMIRLRSQKQQGSEQALNALS